MAIERVFHCDGPDCTHHARTAAPRPPVGFLIVSGHEELDTHFCSWDCVLRFSAAKEPTETIPMGSGPDCC